MEYNKNSMEVSTVIFKKRFKIVEIRDGIIITHVYSKQNFKDLKGDIENFKKKSASYQMFGKEGMVVYM